MFDIEGAKKAGYSEAEIADHLAGQKFDTKAAREAGYSDADIIGHLQAAKPKQEAKKAGAANEGGMLERAIERGKRSPEAALVMGAGAGFGKTMLGAQHWIGKGVKAVGADGAGDWLINDAAQGRAKLNAELEPYREGTGIAADVGEFAGSVVPTLPVGGVLAKGAQAVNAPRLASALRTGGMTTGAPAKAGDLALRTAAGGTVGGVSAGMVDPESAGGGAVIGAALPGVLKAAGAAGTSLANLVRGPQQSQDLAQAVQAAREGGYVIPPTQAKASLVNRLAEGFSGKITTAQNASAKNAEKFAEAAASDLGLPSGTKITSDVLDSVRKAAGQQYEAVKATGLVTPGASYDKALDAIAAPFVSAQRGFPNAAPSPVLKMVDSLRSPQFDAGSAVDMVRALRSQADDAFKAGSSDVWRAAKKAATALEDALEAHLSTVGAPSDLAAFREARKTIAKTYTVEKALNKETGHVDARKWAGDLDKGKPLSGKMEQAARFAARFPKASQPVANMGSLPQTSPLDWIGGASLSSMAGPVGMAGVMARPAVRGYALSDFAQNRLVQAPPSSFSLSELSPLVYRGAPLLATDR